MAQSMRSSQSGFSLLELLVVMTIISILSAIAIPQYNEYKRRGFDVRAQSDLRLVAAAEELYFIDSEKYLSCLDATCRALPGVAALSKGVRLEIVATDESFTGRSSHPQGTGKEFTWDSERGGMQE